MRPTCRIAILFLALVPACAAGEAGPLDDSGPGSVIQSFDAGASQDAASEPAPEGTSGDDASSVVPPGGDAEGGVLPEAGGQGDAFAVGDDGGASGVDSGAPGVDAGGDDATDDAPIDAPFVAAETGLPLPPDSGSSVCADPTSPAGCHACSGSSANCQPNGCFNGYVCDTATNRCHAPGSCP